MQTVVIVIHLLVVLALVGVVLLQRSEGGGLGVGGGSGFMTARGAANALTRATAILATAFFITSLALSLLARYYSNDPLDILDRLPTDVPGQTAPAGGNGVLDQLGGSDAAPAVPAAVTPPSGDAPAAPAATQPTAPAESQPSAPAGDSSSAPTAPAVDQAAPAADAPPAVEPAAPAAPQMDAPAVGGSTPQSGAAIPSGQ